MRTALFLPRGPSRLNTALLFSLLAHALLMSITLGGQTFGLPGLTFPWKARRLDANDLRIQLAPVQAAAPASVGTPALAETLPAMERPVVAGTSKPLSSPADDADEVAVEHIPPATPAPTPAIAAPVTPPEPIVTAVKRPGVTQPIAPNARPESAPENVEARTAPSAALDAAQKHIDKDTQALEQAVLAREKRAAEQLRQSELTAATQREATRQEQLRQDAARADQTAKNEAARMQAESRELARQENLRRDALQTEQARQEEMAQQASARRELERTEAARLETTRREGARQEQARQAQLAAARQDAIAQEAARDEAAKQAAAQREQARQAQLAAARQDAIAQEAARQEAARQAAAQNEQARQAQLETARRTQLEAARQETLKQEAARQEAMSQESARQEAVRQAAARKDQANKEQAQRERAEQEAKREERLRAIGKQLNAEAAQRDAGANRPSSTTLPTVSSLRRGLLLGRADLNKELVLYAEAMGRKIELNMTFDLVREAVKQPHAQPSVTVAVRADGSVEKVTFVTSSGVPAIDEAIRKVVASQAPYPAFPPALARQYDVIEIRRTWIFDTAIRLQ